MTFKFDNGQRVKDLVDGFSGIITGRCEYLNGCRQYRVSPSKLKQDGTPAEGIWIDEAQLTVSGKGISVQKKETGGPQINTPKGKF